VIARLRRIHGLIRKCPLELECTRCFLAGDQIVHGFSGWLPGRAVPLRCPAIPGAGGQQTG
jgi:hypothetical protein